LQPGQIGSMALRNRLVMSPMETMYGTPDGMPSERTRDYFAARAKGGVGLITVGATGIDHHHPETPGGLHLGTDAAVDAHRALVEAVHEHGAKIQPQIVHAGPDGLGPEMHGVTSIGPSVIPSYLTGRPSAEVTRDQLIEVFDLFKRGQYAVPLRPATTASSCTPHTAICSSARSSRRSATAAPTTTAATR
jgi:2,4-dienoyl-CoA reductase (NADPH2)